MSILNIFKKKKVEKLKFDLSKQEDKQKLLELLVPDMFNGAKQPLGDGKAEFLDEGSHEEFEELKKEEAGLKPWYKRIGL